MLLPAFQVAAFLATRERAAAPPSLAARAGRQAQVVQAGELAVTQEFRQVAWRQQVARCGTQPAETRPRIPKPIARTEWTKPAMTAALRLPSLPSAASAKWLATARALVAITQAPPPGNARP